MGSFWWHTSLSSQGGEQIPRSKNSRETKQDNGYQESWPQHWCCTYSNTARSEAKHTCYVSSSGTMMQTTRNTSNPRHQVLLETLAPKFCWASVPKFPKPDEVNSFVPTNSLQVPWMLGSSRMLTAISRGAYSIKLQASIWKPGHIDLLKNSYQRLPPLPPPPLLHLHADHQAQVPIPHCRVHATRAGSTQMIAYCDPGSDECILCTDQFHNDPGYKNNASSILLGLKKDVVWLGPWIHDRKVGLVTAMIFCHGKTAKWQSVHPVERTLINRKYRRYLFQSIMSDHLWRLLISRIETSSQVKGCRFWLGWLHCHPPKLARLNEAREDSKKLGPSIPMISGRMPKLSQMTSCNS